ncbi:MAG: hypothetical protein AAGU12_08530 [Clostridiales bacterium]
MFNTFKKSKRKERPKYIVTALLILIFTIMTMAGCGLGKETTPPPNQGETEPDGTTEATKKEDGGGEATGQEESDAGKFPAYTFASDTLHYKGYNVVDDVLEDHEYVIQAGTATTLKTVLDGYNAVYMVPVLSGQSIEVNSISLEGSLLKIDFTRSIYGNYGSGTELYLLENLFRGYFENVPEVEEITITVDGKAYETGHIVYEPDQVISRDEVMSEG